MKWEKIPNPSHSTEITRSRVPSGWLVCATENVATVFPDGRIETGLQWTTSITFVSDPDNTWDIETEPKCERCKGTGSVGKTIHTENGDFDADDQPCPDCKPLNP